MCSVIVALAVVLVALAALITNPRRTTYFHRAQTDPCQQRVP
jgi:hypothetical protein